MTSRAAILAAAEATFIAQGFTGGSMRRIAEAAGVTPSLIHHHFGSKRVLWNEAKRRRFASYYEQHRSVLMGDRNTVELSCALMARRLAGTAEVLRLIAWMHLEGDTPTTVCSRSCDRLPSLGG